MKVTVSGFRIMSSNTGTSTKYKPRIKRGFFVQKKMTNRNFAFRTLIKSTIS